jgi:uncharacterized protein (TIGR02145 family)
MKSISGWEAPNYGATNESGFSALPGGLRDQNGPFGSINTAAYFWTSEESSSPTYIHFISLNNTSREMDPTAGLVRVPYGLSIRCVKK